MSRARSRVGSLFRLRLQHKLHGSTKTAKLYLVLQNSVGSSCFASPDCGRRTWALVSRAVVWDSESLLSSCCRLLPACTPRSFSPARLAQTPCAHAHTTHCRRVSLALRISSECAVDFCAEINAATPPDQQRFPTSCEVTGRRSELRYRLRPGVGVPSGSANITAKQVKYRVILWF